MSAMDGAGTERERFVLPPNTSSLDDLYQKERAIKLASLAFIYLKLARSEVKSRPGHVWMPNDIIDGNCTLERE